MASDESFYSGSQYPFERAYEGFNALGAYHPEVKNMAYPTDPLTANQLKKVSDKLNTGARTIEVSGLGLSGGGPMKHLASIPRQHWKEIDRLRKLTGVDLTFHGPLVESTGFSRGNWSEDQRKEAETQMKAAVELAQQMNSETTDRDSKGVVMTFHTNNGLPEVKRRVKVKDENGNMVEQIVSYAVINDRTGEVGQIPLQPEYFEKGKGAPFTDQEQVKDWIKTKNKERWISELNNIAIATTRAQQGINEALSSARSSDQEESKKIKEIQRQGLEIYDVYTKDYASVSPKIDEISKSIGLDPETVKSVVLDTVNSLNYADSNLRQAYVEFKQAFNEAYQHSDKDTKKQLDQLRDKMTPTVIEFDKSKTGLLKFQRELNEGIIELKSLKNAPSTYRPLEDFAIDKGSETFSSVALHAYKNAKVHERAPGIISIENPPAGMSGLTRADEIAKLIEASRKKFVEKATKSEEEGGANISLKEAEKVSKQIIGATWDVGHINSIRKWGYTQKDVIGEAKTISPYVKHMHIADNLGFEDAELPIGMGNVPIDAILDSKEAWTENFRKAKKAVETGDWFSRQGGMGMTYTPVRESLSGLTSPVYSMGTGQSAYWNQAVNSYGAYWGGIGDINPQLHHSIYGAGFGGLPSYLGGEIPGRQNSSFSGAPLE